MIVIKGKATFKLPEPVVKLTAAAVCEIVLEVDCRITTKSDFDHFRENPIQSFRSMLQEIDQALTDAVTLYGFRTTRFPGGAKPDQMLQVIAKAPFAQRTKILEASGQTPLLARDFLERGKSSTDTTVLPRFWPPTLQEHQRMKIAIQDVEGLAGVVMTKRGLAPRIWISKITAARSQLLATDTRINKDNIHVVPKISLQLAGWPAATAAEHVVSSTLKALKLAVIPLRTFRIGGVRIWLVTTDTKGGKGQTKGKSKKQVINAWPSSSQGPPPPTSDPRIDKLEENSIDLRHTKAPLNQRLTLVLATSKIRYANCLHTPFSVQEMPLARPRHPKRRKAHDMPQQGPRFWTFDGLRAFVCRWFTTFLCRVSMSLRPLLLWFLHVLHSPSVGFAWILLCAMQNAHIAVPLLTHRCLGP